MGRGKEGDRWGSKVEEKKDRKIRPVYGIEKVHVEKDIGGDRRQGRLKMTARAEHMGKRERGRQTRRGGGDMIGQ